MANKAQSHTYGSLLRGVESTQRASQAAPLNVVSITGVKNSMVDVVSCRFGKNCVPENFFLSHFYTTFPLQQQQYLRHVHLTPETTLLVTSALHGTRFTLQQWMNSYKQKLGQLDGILLGHAARPLHAG